MKHMKDCDISSFIAAVKNQPCLWNDQAQGANNRTVKMASWDIVGETVFGNWNNFTPKEKKDEVKEMTRRWKNMRDSFMREVRLELRGHPRKENRRYVYYEEMKFLAPHLKPRAPIANVSVELAVNNRFKTEQSDNDEDNYELEEYNEETQSHLTPLQRRKRILALRKRKMLEQQTSSAKQMEIVLSSTTKALAEVLTKSASLLGKDSQSSDVFGNRAFLMSCLPMLNTFSTDQCMEAKVKILKAIQDVSMSSSNSSFAPKIVESVSLS